MLYTAGITRSPAQPISTFLIPSTHRHTLHAKCHIHVVDLCLGYLQPPAITLTTGTHFSSLRLSLSSPSPSSPIPFNYHLALWGVLKEDRGARPSLSPSYVRDIDILHKSDMPFFVAEDKLMTEGCKGGEWSRQGVIRGWLCVYWGLCLWDEGDKCAPHANRLIRDRRGFGLVRQKQKSF